MILALGSSAGCIDGHLLLGFSLHSSLTVNVGNENPLLHLLKMVTRRLKIVVEIEEQIEEIGVEILASWAPPHPQPGTSPWNWKHPPP